MIIALLFAVLGVIELWSPIVHGTYFLPGDFGQAWAITKVAHGPKVPANSLESDVYDAFAPFVHYDVAQENDGHLATWNPYDGNGQPYLADAQTETGVDPGNPAELASSGREVVTIWWDGAPGERA